MNKTIEKRYLVPFMLVSILFLLWGLANNMTDTLLAAFKHIMDMSDAQTSLIQFAFYGSYFCFALPAALFIRKYSYKTGVILGLFLYALETMLFYPAAEAESYLMYLFAIYVMAGGCSILETTANPYILSMGTPETATRRLNIAQSLNPIGGIIGILLSQTFILQDISLTAISDTYMGVGVVLIAIMVIMWFCNMPKGKDTDDGGVIASMGRLYHNKEYVFGLVAQFFYLGAQIGVWSFTIRLAMKELNIVETDAADIYLAGIISFCLARFFFTWLMKWYKPVRLLFAATLLGMIVTLVIILFCGTGWPVVIALISISFFMSLQFPTIYGIALSDVGDDSKIGASGLIMMISGGAVLTPVQGLMSDMFGVNNSFLVPFICFAVVFSFSVFVIKHQKRVTS